MKDVLAKAEQAGIPVVTINSGAEFSKRFGALAHFGQDESVAGEAVGEELTNRGLKKAVCVIHEQGNVSLETALRGAKKTFKGTLENLNVDGTNAPATQSSVEAKLQATKGIDAVVTLGAPIAAVAVKAKADAGSKAEIDTFDLNAEVVKRLQAKEVGFAVDQQPYLQGVRGHRHAVALQDQRRHPRRRQDGPDRPGHHHREGRLDPREVHRARDPPTGCTIPVFDTWRLGPAGEMSAPGACGTARRAASRAPAHQRTQQEGHGLVARTRTGSIALAGALGVSLAGCSSTGGKRAEDAQAASAQGRAAGEHAQVDLRDDHPFGRWRHVLGHRAERRQAGRGQGQHRLPVLAQRRGAAAGAARRRRRGQAGRRHHRHAGQAGRDEGRRGARREGRHPRDHGELRSEQSKAFGALAHIGQDETIAGEAVGEELNKRGRKKALCILHEQGNVGHEQRCAGVKSTFHGTVQNLYVQGTSMPDVQFSIGAKLQADRSIDTVVTLGAPYADTAVKAKADAAARPRSTPST